MTEKILIVEFSEFNATFDKAKNIAKRKVQQIAREFRKAYQLDFEISYMDGKLKPIAWIGKVSKTGYFYFEFENSQDAITFKLWNSYKPIIRTDLYDLQQLVNGDG